MTKATSRRKSLVVAYCFRGLEYTPAMSGSMGSRQEGMVLDQELRARISRHNHKGEIGPLQSLAPGTQLLSQSHPA